MKNIFYILSLICLISCNSTKEKSKSLADYVIDNNISDDYKEFQCKTDSGIIKIFIKQKTKQIGIVKKV